MAAGVNVVVLIGNLTKDPELRHTQGGTVVGSMRLAVNTRRKDQTGEWVEKPNYFDITVWGRQAENCAQYLAKGSQVAIDGRLEWREWEAQDGSKRQAVEVVADSVQFLSSGSGGGNGFGRREDVPERDINDDFGAAVQHTPSSDDDIPFAFLDTYEVM